MRSRASLIFPITFVFLAALVSLASVAHAESILWNTSIIDTLCEDPHDRPGMTLTDACHIQLDNPNVSISYNTRVVNADTGAIIACGSSVPAGTNARFEFIPHVYTDINWFGTGYSNDSPYGDWVEAARPPAQVQCLQKDFVSRSFGRVGDSDVYIPLEVNPPTKSVLGLDGLSCTSGGDSQVCQLNSAGTVSAVFQFADTYGKFYARDGRMDSYWASWPYYGECGGGDLPMYAVSSRSAYTLSVPQQEISCPISVTPPVGEPPAAPTLANLASGQCTVGEPHSITMVSTDPDDDGVRYAVDWNANGVVDQYVPGSGFVPSGSTQTVSRTYSIPGSKTVKVLAQDASGNTSNWASISFSCAGSATVGLNEGENDGNAGDGDNDPLALLPDLDLRVIPSLVKSGNTTKVNWSAVNVQSCTVSGENGDSWSGLLSALGGNISQPITGETTYTLSCIDLSGITLTKSATVRIIPTFQEI